MLVCELMSSRNEPPPRRSEAEALIDVTGAPSHAWFIAIGAVALLTAGAELLLRALRKE